MKILLSELKDHKELIGEKINVIRQGGLYHYNYQDTPMMRTLTDVHIRKNTHKGKQETWLEWRWTPDIDPETGKCDCGYSGMRINDNPDFCASFLETNESTNL